MEKQIIANNIFFKAWNHQHVTNCRPEAECSIHYTWFIVTAVWTLAATASTRALILRKFTDWFFCLIAFSAWIRATSIFPFWMALKQHREIKSLSKISCGQRWGESLPVRDSPWWLFKVLLTFLTLAFSSFSSLSHFLEFLWSSLAANFKLKRFSLI